jgi:hypothetical protein
MYELTIFKNAFDNKTHRYLNLPDWGSFVELLEKLSEQPLAGKKDAQLISPAVYKEATTRANRNVEYWGNWACVDVDDYEGTIDEILARFADNNIVIYSTASSTPEKIKFRIVFDLARRVKGDEIKSFWYALNKSIGDLGDKQTKDSSRMYYIPARYVGAHNFFYVNAGVPLGVDDLLREFPYKEKTGNAFLDKLPEDIRDNVLEHRKSSLDNTNVQWTSYRDCPFFPKRMAEDYRGITGTGWYHKMYQIMVAIACNAVKAKYPITETQIAQLCRELDQETGNWYENRPLNKEAGAAINWAYANTWEE